MSIPDITFASKPIVDIARGRVYAQEALIRATDKTPAVQILGSASGAELYAPDEGARKEAI
jgi:hypothetical protein